MIFFSQNPIMFWFHQSTWIKPLEEVSSKPPEPTRNPPHTTLRKQSKYYSLGSRVMKTWKLNPSPDAPKDIQVQMTSKDKQMGQMKKWKKNAYQRQLKGHEGLEKMMKTNHQQWIWKFHRWLRGRPLREEVGRVMWRKRKQGKFLLGTWLTSGSRPRSHLRGRAEPDWPKSSLNYQVRIIFIFRIFIILNAATVYDQTSNKFDYVYEKTVQFLNCTVKLTSNKNSISLNCPVKIVCLYQLTGKFRQSYWTWTHLVFTFSKMATIQKLL